MRGIFLCHFTTYLDSCDHHHKQDTDYPITLMLHSSNIPSFPLPQPLSTTNLISFSMVLSFKKCYLFRSAFFTQHKSTGFHWVVCIHSSFLFIAKYNSIIWLHHIFLTQLPVEGHLGSSSLELLQIKLL